MEQGDGLAAGLVCGAGHSGSTLLGMILGSHPHAFYMGEGKKVRFLGDPAKPVHKRTCKMCGEDCAVWGRFRWDPARGLYAQLAEWIGRRVIIDSTKNDAWIAARIAETRATGGRPCLFFLLRDGRAVVNSRLRKYPDRDPAKLVLDWKAQVERAQELFERFDGPKLCVRYEHLATRPDQVVAAACDVLGLSYDGSMLRFYDAEHHPLGGNHGPQFLAASARAKTAAAAVLPAHARSYYQDHGRGIRLDLRWRHELAAENLTIFMDLAGDFNKLAEWKGND